MKRLLSILSICSSLLVSLSWASSTHEQTAYHACIEHIALHESPLFLSSFSHKDPKVQAKYCVDYLQKTRPDLLTDLDLDRFTQGFVDGRYRKE